MIYSDRRDAGRRLAGRLERLRGPDVVVLGLPRGGVPVAFEVALALGAPLDAIVVRKLGVPFRPELAMGAIGEDGVRILDREIVRRGRITGEEVAAVERRERAELAARAGRFRAGRAPVRLAGRTAVIVDDGMATGSTAGAACQVARAHGAARVVVAVPVAAPEAAQALRSVADEVVCLQTPSVFHAVGQWYQDFAQISDDQVAALLERAASGGPSRLTGGSTDPPVRDEQVRIDAGLVDLAGHLTVPAKAWGTVAFAHGSGSSRHSPRNRQVAAALNRAGLGTLLFDLLTPTEETDRAYVFDVPLLAERLVAATGWMREQPEIAGAAVGYFGASTGAAAALWAAAEPHSPIAAVVSRGGRPDLAALRLSAVQAPTLLIVGGRDEQVLDLNQAALDRLRCHKRLAVVPGATHLFKEPGALTAVANLAADWFLTYLITPSSAVRH